MKSLAVDFYEIQEIQRKELEDKVDFSFFFEGLSDSHHVVASEHFEHFNFALYGVFGRFLLVCLLELLDCHYAYRWEDIPIYCVSLLTAFQTMP